jgi:hypothetical protein
MNNDTPKYGKKYYPEDEGKPLDVGAQFIFMVNSCITYAYELIDALHKHREKGLKRPLPYEEIDRNRRIINYLSMALEEFKNKNK